MAKQDTGRPDESHLPPELALLLAAFRSEFDAKLSALKLWGGLALLGGGTLGGIISRIAFPSQTHDVAAFVVRALS